MSYLYMSHKLTRAPRGAGGPVCQSRGGSASVLYALQLQHVAGSAHEQGKGLCLKF